MMTDPIDEALEKLRSAVGAGKSDTYCLRLWSRFIRERDGHQCVLCTGTSRLAAHHVVRKCFLPYARLSQGNGITLCAECHAEPHASFNRRPDLNLPMDAQGGEKIELLMGFYRALAVDAMRHEYCNADWYYLSARTLNTFKRHQSLPESVTFGGLPVEQAFWIWRQPPHSTFRAILEANGLNLPYGFTMRPSVNVIDDPQNSDGVSVFLMDGLARIKGHY